MTDAPEPLESSSTAETKDAAAPQAHSRELPSLIVAYSGGVDSAYLASSPRRRSEVAPSASPPTAQVIRTATAARYEDRRDLGLNHEIIRTDELARPEYRPNPANRCYYCKHELYTHLTAIARERGIAAIADGSNADDRGDYRPGRQAAREFGVMSPLDAAEPHEERDSRAVATGGASNLG